MAEAQGSVTLSYKASQHYESETLSQTQTTKQKCRPKIVNILVVASKLTAMSHT